MLAGMRSPWDDDARKPEENELYKETQNNELLGQILGRSTSAPPLPSETNADIGGLRYEENAESVSVEGIPLRADVFIHSFSIHSSLCLDHSRLTVSIRKWKTKIADFSAGSVR